MVCDYATIEADHDSAGHHIVGDPWLILQAWEDHGKYRDVSSVFRGRIITFMAGREAEIELLGACGGGDDDDCHQVALMGEQLDYPGAGKDPHAWDRYEARLRTQTRKVVRRHRAKIERVAKALLRDRTLAGPEIDLLTNQSASVT